jgi:phosphatidylglycerophosphate synthase
MGLYRLRSAKDNFLFQIASASRNHGMTPNIVTSFGLCFGVTAGLLFMHRQIPFAFVLGFLSVFCDGLDGTIARKFNLETAAGRVFDSVSDRACELAVVLGAMAGGIIEPLGVLAIVGSTMLFSLRILSHSRGRKTDYVLFGRTERLAFIFIGLVLPLSMASTFCFVVAGAFGIVSSLQIIIELSRRSFAKQSSLQV